MGVFGDALKGRSTNYKTMKKQRDNMNKHAQVREVKLNIESEFILKLVAYFTQVEGFMFVGTENEIWLENVNHPKIQLIHLHVNVPLTQGHTDYIFQKGDILQYKLTRHKGINQRLETMLINTVESTENVPSESMDGQHLIAITSADNLKQNDAVLSYFPKIESHGFDEDIRTTIERLQAVTKKHAMNQIRMAWLKITPLVTYSFTGLIVLFFAYLTVRQQQIPRWFVAIHYGSTYNPLVAGGEVWRLLVSSFMHLDILHLIFNVVFIFRFGAMIEHIFEKWRMVVLILISALMSGLIGFAFTTTHSLGASGVAYGFLGAAVFLGFEMRQRYMPFLKKVILPMILISTFFSFVAADNVDHFGHLGGFIGGFIAATIVGLPRVKPFIPRAIIASITLLVLMSSMWINGVRLTENHDFNRTNANIVLEYYRMGRVGRAYDLWHLFSLEGVVNE